MKKKKTDGAWFVVYALSLIPIIILGFYNFPCADDLGYSIYTRHAWVDTHNIVRVLGAAWQKMAESYMNWQGTWSSIFLMALQPGIFGESWYWLTVPIMIGAISIAVFYLFHCIFIRFLGGTKAVSVAASSILLLIAVQCMVDKTQAFFWYNGAVHYIVPQAVLFLLSGVMMSMAVLPDENRKKQRGLMICGAAAALFIGGTNYVTGLECGIWIMTAMILAVILKSKIWKKLIVFLSVWAVSFAINAAAPGNFVRQEEFLYRPGVVRSILQSFYYCLDFVFNQWLDWNILLLIVLILPFVVRAVQGYRGNFMFRYPLLIPVYSYCILSSMFTPSVFASGVPGAGRIYNIIYLTHLLLIVVNMIYLYGWYWKRYGEKQIEEKKLSFYQIFSMLTAFFIFGITAAVNHDTYTSVSAATAIVDGEAQRYKEEEKRRMEILADGSIPDAVLDEFSVKPYLLFYEDIEEDTGNWKNVRMGQYYRKNSVSLHVKK